MIENTIEFRTTHNKTPKWVMRITADRRIEVNEDVEVTEVATKVLEAMQWMLDKQQRTWVGLTDEEFKQIMLNTYNIDLNVFGHSSDDHLLWNAIEAKLKEKNT